jgi:16S rRNA processing protein RimM
VPEVVVGTLGKPFGIRGAVYVHPDPDVVHDFAPGTAYTLPDGRTLIVSSTHVHGRRRTMMFEGVADREGAEALRGAVLTVSRDAVELEEDAFWTTDLIGLEVRDPAGAVVGVVESTLDGPAHDYLVVARPDGGEALIPAVDDLVEVTSDAVIVRAIPGLLDPDEV